MENTGPQSQPVQTKRRGVQVPVLLSIILILVVAGFVTAYALGYIRVVNPATAGSVNGGLCASIIPDYNKAFEAENGDAYKVAITNAARNAEAVEGNEGDPTCVYIQYTSAVLSSSKDDATRFAGILEALAEEGKYITGELANPMGIDSIVNGAKALNETLDTQQGQGSEQGNG